MSFTPPRRVLVVGLGRSGLAAARLAAEDGAEVWVTDQRSGEELENLEQLPTGTRLFLGGHPEECLDGVELLLVSPGVPPTVPTLRLARSRSIPVLTELEYAWLHRSEAPLVAVTGSNGKSTVTVLAAKMLRAGGITAVEGGNLGTAACDLVLGGGWTAWVLEVSSFQSELLTTLRPRVGVFLNLSQDHLERHPDLAGYLAAKQRLLSFQEATDAAVLNADDEQVSATPTRARRLHFCLRGQADGWLDGERLMVAGEQVLDTSQMALSGRHNVANALAAGLAAHDLGVATDQIAAVLRSFEGLEHRHQTVLEHRGVRWINDSKATNIGATLAALQGYAPRSVRLILGGLAKGQDFTALASEVERTVVRLYLIGQDAQLIAASLHRFSPITHCSTLEAAVQTIHSDAQKGETVLLAPACASFDQFPGYTVRGERFAALVRQEVAPCP